MVCTFPSFYRNAKIVHTTFLANFRKNLCAIVQIHLSFSLILQKVFWGGYEFYIKTCRLICCFRFCSPKMSHRARAYCTSNILGESVKAKVQTYNISLLFSFNSTKELFLWFTFICGENMQNNRIISRFRFFFPRKVNFARVPHATAYLFYLFILIYNPEQTIQFAALFSHGGHALSKMQGGHLIAKTGMEG